MIRGVIRVVIRSKTKLALINEIVIIKKIIHSAIIFSNIFTVNMQKKKWAANFRREEGYLP